MIGRVHGWERGFAEELTASMRLPFEWHENDCCAFAARCVRSVTGFDPFDAFRGSYSNQRAALRVLKQHGGLLGICDALFGDRRNPLLARRGDLVLVKDQTETIVAVCAGRYALAPGPGGLVQRPQGIWLSCWQVG